MNNSNNLGRQDPNFVYDDDDQDDEADIGNSRSEVEFGRASIRKKTLEKTI